MALSASEAHFEIPFPEVLDRPACDAEPLEVEITGLFRQLRNPLLRYLLTLGLAEHDGEEITQDVFLALFQHLRRGGGRQNLRGWLFRVGHNLGLKRRKAMQREVQDDLPAAREVDPALNPEEELANAQRQKRLLAVFRALPEQDQSCLALRAEGLRYREIAEVLSISLGSVSMSLARSLARLERAVTR